jgi:hypothetical protein
MNERIRELIEQAGIEFTYDPTEVPMRAFVEAWEGDLEKFAELIVEECRNVVTEVYRNTPLELCGPLLTADEEIAKHFYGVEE